MFKIVVGTTSEQKIVYLKEVLIELGVEAEVIPSEVESGVAFQPMTSLETKQGSINRAEKALEKNPGANCGIGIEVGYEQNKEEEYVMFSWSTIVDDKGRLFSGQSHCFILPRFHQEVLKNGLYLGDCVREYFKISDDRLTQIVGEDICGRKPFIVSSLKLTLIYFLKEEEY